MATTRMTPSSSNALFSIKPVQNDKTLLSKGTLLTHSGTSCRSCGVSQQVVASIATQSQTLQLFKTSSELQNSSEGNSKKPNDLQSNRNDNENCILDVNENYLIPQSETGTETVPLVYFEPDEEITMAESEEKTLFRSMTFNLRFDTPRDGPNVWNNRKHLVASTIHFHRPDVFGVQEAMHHQMMDLSESLPEYGWVGVGRNDGAKAGEYCAVFYRRRKFDSIDSGTFWLSETPDVQGSKSWDSACVRICSWVRLKFKAGNNEIFVFNAHLDHYSDKARAQAAILMSRHIPIIVRQSTNKIPSESAVSIIVMGDFNDFPSSVPYNTLVNSSLPPLPEGAQLPEVLQFRDTRTTAKHKHNADAGSFTDWISPEQHTKPQILIDYILYYGNLEPETYGIICELFNGKQASDHRPLVSDFYLNSA